MCGLSEGWSGAAAGLGISEMDEILSKSKHKDTTTLLIKLINMGLDMDSHATFVLNGYIWN